MKVKRTHQDDANILPDLQTRRAMLDGQINQLKQEAFALHIQSAVTRSQGLDPASRSETSKLADDLDKKRKNALRALAKVQQMSRDLPDEIPEGDDGETETDEKLAAVP